MTSRKTAQCGLARSCRRLTKIAGILALVLGVGGGSSAYAGNIFSGDHTYGFGADPAAVQIHVDVDLIGSNYQWTYTVTNNSYDPNPGSSNGFSGFELMLPAFVPDIGNVTKPNPSWVIDCCSGLPVEWDITNTGGMGIMPGEVGVFSFTTLPRLISQSSGWFHTWQSDVQTDLVFYPEGNKLEVPDVLQPPTTVPEPGTWSLLAIGVLAFLGLRRRN